MPEPHEFLPILEDPQIEALAARVGGIAGLVPGILDGAEELPPNDLPARAELCNLFVQEVVHSLGPHITGIALFHVLGQLQGYSAVGNTQSSMSLRGKLTQG